MNQEISKNLLLAGVSTLTYATTQLGCNNKHIETDSLTFGVLNGLAQQFIPKFVDNQNFQSLFIDPLVASIAQSAVKILVYGHPQQNGIVLLKSIVAGVSASALTLHMMGNKRY